MRYGLRLDLGLMPGGKIGAKAVNARRRSSRLSPEMSNEVADETGRIDLCWNLPMNSGHRRQSLAFGHPELGSRA